MQENAEGHGDTLSPVRRLLRQWSTLVPQMLPAWRPTPNLHRPSCGYEIGQRDSSERRRGNGQYPRIPPQSVICMTFQGGFMAIKCQSVCSWRNSGHSGHPRPCTRPASSRCPSNCGRREGDEIAHEYNDDRHQLGRPLVNARKRLGLQYLIEKGKHHGEDGPGVWRLTQRGQAVAQFIKRYRFP